MSARTASESNTDGVLLAVVLLLTCIGVLLIFDASYAYALQRHISGYKYVGQQAGWAVLGIAVMLVVMRFPYRKLENLAVPLVVMSAMLLIAVFIPHIGSHEVNGAKRWVGVGAFRLQPSEIAKLAIVLYIARLCAGRPKAMSRFTRGPMIPLCVMAVLALLIEREPDMGTCLVLLGAGMGALYFAGMRYRHFFAVAVAGLVLIGGMLAAKGSYLGRSDVAANSPDYRTSRIDVWLHPDLNHTGEGYQVYHSMIALGTGGIFGLGVGNGRQKYYLPEAHTDFIFATLAEEGGLITSLLVLALLGVLVTRGLHIATLTKDPFGAILAGGISAGFGVQTLLNIGVVTSAIPATGVPLPFLSYGGSSLLISLVSVGILLSVYRFSDRADVGRVDTTQNAPERDFERRRNRGAILSRPEHARNEAYRGTHGYRQPQVGATKRRRMFDWRRADR